MHGNFGRYQEARLLWIMEMDVSSWQVLPTQSKGKAIGSRYYWLSKVAKTWVLDDQIRMPSFARTYVRLIYTFDIASLLDCIFQFILFVASVWQYGKVAVSVCILSTVQRMGYGATVHQSLGQSMC